MTERWLAVRMKQLVRSQYGNEPADKFRASYGWLGRFASRYNLSLRRANNHKHQSVEVRLPKIKRWHARFRRRLKACNPETLHPKWGRWLPRDRLSIDQVPCNLREGGKCTYDEKGATRIWLAGTKADDGKRFCTLQIIARAANGAPGTPRRGQPKIGVIFRGQGKRISAEERAGWHPDCDVRFQPKAWADAEYCELHAAHEMVAATEPARRESRESVAIYDNLYGQTTAEHEQILSRKAKCARHLLPTGVTAEIQLIDDGVGYAVKNEMGYALDSYLEEGENLQKWTNEGEHGFAMWEKRVLITRLAGEAWERVCERFDFEKAATRIGMMLTIDGTGDDLLKIQGVEKYSFTDADGGPAGEVDKGLDPVETQEDEAEVQGEEGEQDDEEGEGHEGEGNEGEEDEASDSDHEDDTAVHETLVGPAPEDPPLGYSYVEEAPPVATEADQQLLVGRHVLYAWDEDDIRGWFMGKITHRGCSASDLRKTPTANFVVAYNAKVTKNRKLNGRVASTLTPEKYGMSEWWMLLESIKES